MSIARFCTQLWAALFLGHWVSAQVVEYPVNDSVYCYSEESWRSEFSWLFLKNGNGDTVKQSHTILTCYSDGQQAFYFYYNYLTFTGIGSSWDSIGRLSRQAWYCGGKFTAQSFEYDTTGVLTGSRYYTGYFSDTITKRTSWGLEEVVILDGSGDVPLYDKDEHWLCGISKKYQRNGNFEEFKYSVECLCSLQE